MSLAFPLYTQFGGVAIWWLRSWWLCSLMKSIFLHFQRLLVAEGTQKENHVIVEIFYPLEIQIVLPLKSMS